ncbi:ABC transporter permease [Carnobacteriaceae bacterium zg-ZUI240]|nr:ABC transporter permease [Carnobacteriaceae bacterium zg-ZUI240]
MLKYSLKRIIQAIPLVLLISLIVFFLIDLAPYNAVDAMITPEMTQEQIDFLRLQSGVDQPFWVRYWSWLTSLLQGNFGKSLVSNQAIGPELISRIPNTVVLVLPAYLTALGIAIALGLVAAANKGKWLDQFLEWVASMGIALPTFWVAMLLIYVFGYQLGWFEIVGMYSVGSDRSFGDFLSHYVLPFTTLVINFFPRTLRYVRSSALEQLSQDYVTVQRAFQSKRGTIFAKHISRHILIPVVTQIGLALPMLVTGALITETIFAWPGIGPYMMTATRGLDYPIIMAVMLLSSTLVILGNLLADILYYVVDPRIRKEGR